MKNFLLSLLITPLLIVKGFAQKNNYRRAPAFGVSFVLNDFKTAQRIRTTSLSHVLANDEWAKFRNMAPGLGITYFEGLSNFIDFAGTVAGSYADIALPNRSSTLGDQFLLEADASVNIKLMSDRYFFTPYVNLGVGASLYNENFGAFMPLGIGFKFNILDEAAVFINSQYRVPITNETNTYHFFNSIGISGNIGKRREAAAVITPPRPVDTDADGITDDRDKCPTVPGVLKYEGCPVPDTDKDGINDENDECPTAPGVARYNGCPVPDSDKDGINDEEDKCKDIPGVARYEGCPVPDTDKDGVDDEEDRCPTVPGTRENNGCPEVKQEVIQRVNYAARNIYFATGSAKLLSKSFKPLNDVAQILKDDPNLKLAIEGHTDNVGTDEYNQTLSDNRANSVKAYLVSKGIDESRLAAQGFGESQPVADNNTAAGRAKNRRVVLTLSYQ
ncbi:MAG: OmpA family protein [Chitinophagaceae bacterium]|nr:OmpA family protein [Chitinophagaceae bacterium]